MQRQERDGLIQYVHYRSMEVKNSDQWLNECHIAWLTVEKDLSAKLQTPESLKYGKQSSRNMLEN